MSLGIRMVGSGIVHVLCTHIVSQVPMTTPTVFDFRKLNTVWLSWVQYASHIGNTYLIFCFFAFPNLTTLSKAYLSHLNSFQLSWIKRVLKSGLGLECRYFVQQLSRRADNPAGKLLSKSYASTDLVCWMGQNKCWKLSIVGYSWGYKGCLLATTVTSAVIHWFFWQKITLKLHTSPKNKENNTFSVSILKRQYSIKHIVFLQSIVICQCRY